MRPLRGDWPPPSSSGSGTSPDVRQPVRRRWSHSVWWLRRPAPTAPAGTIKPGKKSEMTTARRFSHTPWILERIVIALMVGGLLAAILIVGWAMT